MLPRLLATLAFGLAASAGIAAPRPPDVLVVSDVLSDTPEALRPQPGKPIHYIIIGELENNLGTPIAGEPAADRATVEREVVKVLASQGFLLTKPGGPMPKIALLIMWGSAVLDTSELPVMPLPQPDFGTQQDPTALPPPPPPDTMLLAFNGPEIASLVGADKTRGIANPNVLSQINDAATTPRVYIFIGAFDVETMLKKKERKLVWRTRMSIPSTHNTLPDSLGLLLTSAAPFFARESTAPVFIGEADRRKANVEVGMPYVVPESAEKKK
jgi:hypothetical protein